VRTVHASAVLVGAHAVLIRGASGSGKSRLTLELLQAADRGALPFARLVADDRVLLLAENGRLIAQPPDPLAGLLEVRGLGILRLPYEHAAVVRWVVDLGEASERLPAEDASCSIRGVTLPRFAFPSCIAALPVLLAALPARVARGTGIGDR